MKVCNQSHPFSRYFGHGEVIRATGLHGKAKYVAVHEAKNKKIQKIRKRSEIFSLSPGEIKSPFDLRLFHSFRGKQNGTLEAKASIAVLISRQ